MAAQSERPKQKLLDQVRAVLREKYYSIHTEHTYVNWIKRFILFHKTEQDSFRHPQDMAAPEIKRFLTHLAVDRRIAASTQQQALSALFFLYHEVLDRDPGVVVMLHPNYPDYLPASVLTREQVGQVITVLSGGNRLVIQLLYGAGLRLIECLRLRVGDVDFDLCQIVVRDGKGWADHVTMLPQSLVAPLREQIERAAALHRLDISEGFGAAAGAVYLPPVIKKEHPRAHRQWRWQYVFPAHKRSLDPRSDITRRHHLGPSGPQKAVRQAARSSGIHQQINCRAFRDAFAAHLLEAGYDVRTVQELLGHRDVNTTLDRYTHVLKRPGPVIHSPLDRITAGA
ncbi:MAG: integron integrase [Chloroflexi bacterium]|nr:integron integrase [Chloroflexota bacterium]